MASKRRSENMLTPIEKVARFRRLDTSDFPDFYSYRRILDMALWVLWAAKEKLGIKELTANEISSIMREVKEVTVPATSIAQSLRRAGDKIHIHREKEATSYEIMMAGKEHLQSASEDGAVNVFYFEPGQQYSSKSLLTKSILERIDGELRIVDPYCGERTLDCLKDIKGRRVKLLTRMENLPQKSRDRLLREIQDFKSENPDIEFRSYPDTDLHDRYIISPSSLVILGHSIKDLGGKESFAIVLNESTSKNVVEALSEAFDRRWEQSSTL